MKRIKQLLNTVANWKWDKIANIMVVIGIILAMLTYHKSNVQFEENLRHSEQLYRKDSILFQKQLELSNDPIIQIITEDQIKGEIGVFKIKLRNSGISDIQNIEIFDDYYVANKPKNGRVTLYRFGILSTVAQIAIPIIESKSDQYFTLDFSNINKQMTDFYLSQKGCVMKVARISIIYERKVDGKKYDYKKLFIIAGHGDYLIDNNDRDMITLPDLISFDELKNILGVK